MPGGALPDLRVDGHAAMRLAAVLLMSADTSRDRLRLTADDTTITADGSDATRVTFRATDVYGNHRPHMTGEVTLTLTGPAVRIGQNPFAFGSYGGAFVRSVPGKTGQVMVTAARHAGQRVRASHRRGCLSGQISFTGPRGAELRVCVEGSAPRRTFISHPAHGVVNW